MNAKKMMAVVCVLAMAFAALAFVPAEENSAADEKEIVYFEGGELSSTLTGTTSQKVIIQKDLVIKKGGQILIEGDLEIPTGVTVTIEDGTAVQNKGIFTIYGNAVIDGTITSKVEKGLYIEPDTGDTININGSISAVGDASGKPIMAIQITVGGGSNVDVYGDFIIGANAEVDFEGTCFMENSTLTVNGFANGTINVAGAVVFNGSTNDPINEMDDELSIYIMEKSATISIVKVVGTVEVTDESMFAYAYGGFQYYVGEVFADAPAGLGRVAIAEFVTGGADKTVEANFISFTNVENVKVTEKVTTFMAYDEDLSDDWMCAATEMIFSPLDSAKAVEGVDKKAAISTGSSSHELGETINFETMTIKDVAVTFTKDAKKVIIRGDVTYPLQDNVLGEGKFVIKNEMTDYPSVLEITGCLAILKKTSDDTLSYYVNAAHYKVKDADNNYDHYYTTLERAIKDGAQAIDMMGYLKVEKDIEIPAPVELTATTVSIGKGAKLTIDNGAGFKATGTLSVHGSLEIMNINSGIKLTNVYADVKLQNDAYVLFTNIYVAFEQAKSGDKISALCPATGGIVLDEDLILPAGVTFYNVREKDSLAFAIEVKNGVTFTIAGKLLMSCDTSLMAENNAWNTKTPAVDPVNKVVKDYSVLAIGANGMIVFESKNGGVYDTHAVAGAYFSKGTPTNYYITNIAYAFENILDADLNTVDIANENTIENLKVTGTETERIVVNFLSESKIAMKNFTFAYGKVTVDANANKMTLTGDIGTATGKMIFNDAEVSPGVIFEEVFINDAMNLVVAGTIASNNVTEISGIVFLKDFVYTTDGSDAASYKLLTFAEKRFVVPAGAAAFIDGTSGAFADVELLIAGELTVMKGAILTAGAASYVSVLGTLTVPKVDGTDAQTSIFNLIIGGSTDSFDKICIVNPEGNALVAGDGKFNGLAKMAAYVFGGSNVTADVLVSWMKDAKSTEFNVDGALWMSAYAGENVDIKIATTIEEDGPQGSKLKNTEYNLVPALKDMKFNGWQTYDEKTKTYKAIEGVKVKENTKYTYVGDAGYTKVYADITKDLYNIYVIADEGIDNVYMDGILMINLGNRWFAQIEAGSHTLGYTLGNGYSGNAVITTIDGKKTAGTELSFTVNDDKYDSAASEMVITLSGIQKSGIDIDPDTHKETSAGLSVTEILLIVVVVIIAVMAVVLILRLNRS